jgi:excisionase family DNA binding protein
MSELYYTVQQIAKLLAIHPKTIQRYIREGRLKAQKIGKSWRVGGHDLSVFAEGPQPPVPPGRLPANLRGQSGLAAGQSDGPRDVRISSVIDIDIRDRAEAERILNTMIALLNSKPTEAGQSTMSAQVIEPERKVRLVFWGNLPFMEDVLAFIKMLTTDEPAENEENGHA